MIGLQCKQQCMQCNHSASKSAYSEAVFSLVTGSQCKQCIQVPVTLLRAHAHAGETAPIPEVDCTACTDRHSPAVSPICDRTRCLHLPALVHALTLAHQHITGGAR